MLIQGKFDGFTLCPEPIFSPFYPLLIDLIGEGRKSSKVPTMGSYVEQARENHVKKKVEEGNLTML